jgi:hypothetical protein
VAFSRRIARDPEETSRIASKYQTVYPGSYTPFSTKDIDSHANPVNAPEQAETIVLRF